MDTNMNSDIRELDMCEVDAVSAGALPAVAVYYGLRAGGGALIGAGLAIANEMAGDGLSWSDWDEVAIGAGAGALGGLGGGMYGHAGKFLSKM